MIIAIDGPAGAGKSTVAREVARALGFLYLDTGAMYRAVTLEALERGLDPRSAEDCARLAREVALGFDADGRIQIDGRPGEPRIREQRVRRHVSAVSAHPGVRAAIVARQREIAQALPPGGGLVAEGRDTTTIVFPRAEHKFFLIASLDQRAERRARELGQLERLEEVRREIAERDRLDSTREVSPLRQAADAAPIDTGALDATGVAEEILRRVRPAPEPVLATTIGEAPIVTKKSAQYVLIVAMLRGLYALFLRPRIAGRGHLPASGGALLVANHQSVLDIPLIAMAARRHVSFVARDSLARSRLLGQVMRDAGAVLIRRGVPDRSALRAMVAHLERGDLVAIFPEGTRSADGRLGRYHGGALLAARLARVPIVPVAIRGTFQAWPRGARLPRPHRVSIAFAPPIEPRSGEALAQVRAAIAERAGDGRCDPPP